jgi:phage-related protein
LRLCVWFYVLRCFQKKTKTTTKHDKNIAEARYRTVVRERSA